jgi:uncharacterized alkaline shock family protein YloU
VRSTVEAIRSTVTSELERIAGYRVGSLAVVVSGLRGEKVPESRLQ